jgi:hypothetical protein
MSKTRKLGLLGTIASGTLVVAVLGGAGTAVAITAHNAQVQEDAARAMHAAAPAYQGAIELGGNLDALNTQSVQAKQAYDAEQARIAAEKAAEAAAAAQAAAQLAAQQAAAQQAAAQQAAQQQARGQAAQTGSSGADTSSDPVKCPSGTIAQAVDANGNESNCQPLGPTGTQCVAYDANNNCTAWLKP